MPRSRLSHRAEPHSAVLELAELWGVAPSYIDSAGQRQRARREALESTLRALGADLSRGPRQAIRSRLGELGSRVLEPTMVAWDGVLSSLPIRLPRGSALLHRRSPWKVVVELDDGGTQTAFITAEEFTLTANRNLPGILVAAAPLGFTLPMGYHRLRIEAGAGRHTLHAEATVIAAPRRCYADSAKTWGTFLPLYALRSRRDWGTGDFASLRRLHEWTRARGGAWTGTLPLLAAFLDEPFEPSPYMPVSRLFWNELFISPEAEPEFSESPQARRMAGSSRWRGQLSKLRRADHVDYAAAMRLKRGVLEDMARQLVRKSGLRREEFESFVRDHPRMTEYARFRAAVERRGQSWPRWPQRMRGGELRAADAQPASEHYHYYVQWIAEQQLARIGKDAGGGLYLDFPLGVHPGGFDVWRNQHLFALGAAAGAPPDALFPDGQNWAFPPLHPEALRRDGYRYFREALSQQMRHAGMLRVDHVMGLNRLYWIPHGIATREGVYVEYPAEEMYAVLSLQSHRAQCVVVGENLGTVPDVTSQAMRRHGVRGMHILQFGVSADGRSPLASPAAGEVASLNTHDTPPFAGFLAGKDIEDFRRLGVLTAEKAAQNQQERQRLVGALKLAMRAASAKPAEVYRRMLAGCLRQLGESRAAAVILNLEDLWAELEPQNIPGTGPGTAHPEQPNWRRKARRSVERIAADKELAELLGKAFALRNSRRRARV